MVPGTVSRKTGRHHSRPDDAAGGGQRCTGQSRGRRRGTGPAAYFHLAGPARRVGIRRRTRCRTATNRCHSRSRGIGNDQRPGKTLLAPQRPPLHGRRHRRLDGRLHVVRRVDHLRRGQADLLVSRSVGRTGRYRDNRRSPERDDSQRLCRPVRQSPGGCRLDHFGCTGRGAARRTRFRNRPGRTAGCARRSGRGCARVPSKRSGR